MCVWCVCLSSTLQAPILYLPAPPSTPGTRYEQQTAVKSDRPAKHHNTTHAPSRPQKVTEHNWNASFPRARGVVSLVTPSFLSVPSISVPVQFAFPSWSAHRGVFSQIKSTIQSLAPWIRNRQCASCCWTQGQKGAVPAAVAAAATITVLQDRHGEVTGSRERETDRQRERDARVAERLCSVCVPSISLHLPCLPSFLRYHLPPPFSFPRVPSYTTLSAVVLPTLDGLGFYKTAYYSSTVEQPTHHLHSISRAPLRLVCSFPAQPARLRYCSFIHLFILTSIRSLVLAPVPAPVIVPVSIHFCVSISEQQQQQQQ